MENLDIVILTVIVVVLYLGFAIALFSIQKGQQHLKKK